MQERNIELGRTLQAARLSRNVSISECAALIGSGRPRYRDIESGESYVTVVELELLMRHLHIPMDAIWPGDGDSQRKIRRLPVTVSADETLYVVVDIQR
jgi:transcriptional regulator with XRE-family HTH domain